MILMKSDNKIASVMTEYQECLQLHSTYTINCTRVTKVKSTLRNGAEFDQADLMTNYSGGEC